MGADAARLDPRVVETYCRFGLGKRVKAGSGYLLDNGLVLASAHTVPIVDGVRQVTVKCAHDERSLECEVVWSAYHAPSRDRGVDAALLRITDPSWSAPAGLAALRWGRLATALDEVAVTGAGFPAAMRTYKEDGRLSYRDTVQFEGRIERRPRAAPPRVGAALRLWRVRLEALAPPVPAAPDQKPLQRWSGLSGSAVLGNGLLLGVVAKAAPEPDAGRLWVVPVTTLFAHEGFRALIGPTLLESAEFEPILARRIAPNPYSPASLLHPDAQAVGFHGRESTERRLRQWCTGSERISVRLITGRGGAGKTRLGREFAAALRADGWAAGFLEEGAAPSDLEVLRRAESRVLLVIDYAESRVGQIRELMAAAQAPERLGGSPALRILLLARDVGDWWHELNLALPGIRRLSADSVLPLPDLEPTAARRKAAVLAAMRELARRLPPPADGSPAPRFEADPRPPDVTHARYSNALNLQTAALVAVLQQVDPVEADPRDSDEVVLLRHEQKFWLRTAARYGLKHLRLSDYGTAVAAATLCQALDEQSAVQVLDRLGVFGQDADADADDVVDLGDVARWLASLYPLADKAWWGPLQPDRLGEHLVGAVLRRHSDLFRKLLPAAPAQQTLGALRVAARAELHQPHVAGPLREVVVEYPDHLAAVAVTAATQVENPRPLREALGTVVENAASSVDGARLLVELYSTVPLQTSALNKWALELAGRLVDQARTRTSYEAGVGPDDAAPAELAHRLNNYALRLSGMGDHELALAAAEQSVVIRQRLAAPIEAATDPRARAGLQRLQLSLNTLSGAQAGLERWDEALATAQKVAQFAEALVRHDSQANLDGLAMALTNYANQLGYVGRSREAIAPARRAVKLYQRLAAADSETYLPDLALGYYNLADCLEDAGRLRSALVAAKRAVANYYRAAIVAPDAYNADLADAHARHAIVLSELGFHDQASAAIEEAVDLYHRLVESAPEIHRPGLLNSLNTMTAIAAGAGHDRQARAASTEALALCRTLYTEQPGRYAVELASALNNEATELSNEGRVEEALEISVQSMALYRTLARSHSREHLPDLARALNNHADHLAEAGHLEEAAEAAGEAVALLRKTTTEESTQLRRQDLAVALDTHAARLADVGDSEAAVERCAEAVRLLRQLVREEPAAHVSELARVLENQAIMLIEIGERTQARVVLKESLALRRRAAKKQPSAHREALAAALGLAASVTEADEDARASDLWSEAIAQWRILAAADPRSHGPELAGALTNHALVLSRAGRPSAALKAAEEAVALYRDLAEEDPETDPETLLPKLANALNVESIGWLELDWADPGAHADRALAAADGARDVWQRVTDVEPRSREASPLAVSHHLRALSMSQLGRSEEAVGAAEVALRYWQALASQEPGTYDGDIADALSTLAEVLSAAGHPEQALGPAEQAVAYYEPRVSTEDEDVEAELWEGAGSVWKVHAVALCGVERYADAVVYAAKSVRVYRELAEVRPRAMLPDLIETLRTYAVALDGGGQRAQAQAERDEADRLTAVLNGLE